MWALAGILSNNEVEKKKKKGKRELKQGSKVWVHENYITRFAHNIVYSLYIFIFI